MVKEKRKLQTSHSGDREAIEHFKQAIASGKHWYIALLEAIGLWSSHDETRNGRYYRYLIDGQAFDWLLLAERLCQEVDGLIAKQEVLDLLLWSKLPLELTAEEFEALIGKTKYRAYLSYFYGVIVEWALLLAVDDEIDKEQRAQVYENRSLDSYQRIYDADQRTLLKRFREEKGHPQRSSIALCELREFTYWLFKYRLRNSDKARVASDTKKALAYLERLRGTKELPLALLGEQAMRIIEL